MATDRRPDDMARITTPELADAFIEEQIAALRAQIGNKKVLLALSGGVDSSVVAAMLIKAVGDQLVCVHVNHGLLRKGEPEQVIKVFRDELGATLIYVDAADRFLDKLAGVSDPETKRKIIGKEFIDVFAEEAKKLDALPNDDVDAYRAREKKYADNMRSVEYADAKTLADLWGVAFMWRKTTVYDDFNPTHAIFAECRRKGAQVLSDQRKKRIRELADEYQFFHWKLEFPDVFDGVKDGFDVVLGNPPWERVKIQKKEWFALRAPEIADAKNNAEREKLIKKLGEERPELLKAFDSALRKAEATSVFIRTSGRFPICGRGDVNTYAVFSELNTILVSPQGRVGFIVPTGIATDDSTKAFFQYVTRNKLLKSLYDFENRKKLFPDVDSRQKFSLITISGCKPRVHEDADFAFFNLAVSDVQEEGKVFKLTLDEIAMVNPNTQTSPICQSLKDSELTKTIYRRVPILEKEGTTSNKGNSKNDTSKRRNKNDVIRPSEENPWGIKLNRMFDMSNDSKLFRSYESLEHDGYKLRGSKFVRDDGTEYWPLYEAKMIHQYNHRFGDYSDLPKGSKSTNLPDIPTARLHNKGYTVLPRYWIDKTEVFGENETQLPFLIGFRKICRSTDERTIIPSIIPQAGAGDSIIRIDFGRNLNSISFLVAELSSMIHDYVARQKSGGTNLAFFVTRQISTFPPREAEKEAAFLPTETHLDFVLPRVLELTYTASDLREFAESCGDHGEPFVWDDRRRFLLRCELDALYFGLYLGFGEWSKAEAYRESEEDRATLERYFPTPLDALDHVMGTFPIVRRKELADELKTSVASEALKARGLEPGDRYPTHAVVRAMYEEMVDAIREGKEWTTWLDPAPADDSLRHPAG